MLVAARFLGTGRHQQRICVCLGDTCECTQTTQFYLRFQIPEKLPLVCVCAGVLRESEIMPQVSVRCQIHGRDLQTHLGMHGIFQDGGAKKGGTQR